MHDICLSESGKVGTFLGDWKFSHVVLAVLELYSWLTSNSEIPPPLPPEF